MFVINLFGNTYAFGRVKKCTNCKDYHFVEDFYADRSSKSGLMAWCKLCCYRHSFNGANREITKLSKVKVKKQLKKVSKSFK
jgi:hypothetical protein